MISQFERIVSINPISFMLIVKIDRNYYYYYYYLFLTRINEGNFIIIHSYVGLTTHLWSPKHALEMEEIFLPWNKGTLKIWSWNWKFYRTIDKISFFFLLYCVAIHISEWNYNLLIFIYIVFFKLLLLAKDIMSSCLNIILILQQWSKREKIIFS